VGARRVDTIDVRGKSMVCGVRIGKANKSVDDGMGLGRTANADVVEAAVDRAWSAHLPQIRQLVHGVGRTTCPSRIASPQNAGKSLRHGCR